MTYNRHDVPLFSEDQTPKQCKKQTPDYQVGVKGVKSRFKKGIKPRARVKQIGFRVNDLVKVKNVQSLVNNKIITGTFKFDSYDKYDNTCYIADEFTGFTWNVLLSDLELYDVKKEMMIMSLSKMLKAEKNLVDQALIENRHGDIADLQRTAFCTGKTLRKLLK